MKLKTLQEVYPYILLYNLPNEEALSTLIQYFILMTPGMKTPTFVIGQESYLKLFPEKRNILNAYNDNFGEIGDENYKMIIILEQLLKYGQSPNFKASNGIKRTREESLSCFNLPKVYPAPIEGIGFKRWFIHDYARKNNQRWILCLDQNCGPIERCIVNNSPYLSIKACPSENQCFMTFSQAIEIMVERDPLSENIDDLIPAMWGIRVGTEGSPRSMYNITGAVYKFALQDLDGIPSDVMYHREFSSFGEDLAFAKDLENSGRAIVKFGFISLIRLDEGIRRGIRFCQPHNSQLLTTYLQACNVFTLSTGKLLTENAKALFSDGYLLGFRLADYCQTYKDLTEETEVVTSPSKDPLVPIIDYEVKSSIYNSSPVLFKIQRSGDYYKIFIRRTNNGERLNPKAYEYQRNPSLIPPDISLFSDPEKSTRIKKEIIKTKVNLDSNKYAINWIYIDIFNRIIKYLNSIETITSERRDDIISFLKPFPEERRNIVEYIDQNIETVEEKPKEDNSTRRRVRRV